MFRILIFKIALSVSSLSYGQTYECTTIDSENESFLILELNQNLHLSSLNRDHKYFLGPNKFDVTVLQERNQRLGDAVIHDAQNLIVFKCLKTTKNFPDVSEFFVFNDTAERSASNDLNSHCFDENRDEVIVKFVDLFRPIERTVDLFGSNNHRYLHIQHHNESYFLSSNEYEITHEEENNIQIVLDKKNEMQFFCE